MQAENDPRQQNDKKAVEADQAPAVRFIKITPMQSAAKIMA